MIGLRRLRLTGLTENYQVDFCSDDGRALPLSIIAGEISTGKTAVLEFVDYCLGKRDHPGYVEIQRQARSAQLEVDLTGELYVIERPLFSDDSAWLHHCQLDQLEEPHATSKIAIDPAGDRNSLNWLLLSHSGLEGVVLKEAPTKAVTETDPLSFRDVMWLAFLDGDRLLSRNLLHESSHIMKRLKLKQLIEVVFGVHDQDLAGMGDRIRLLEKEREAQKAEIQSLDTFLKEQEVPGRLEIQAKISDIVEDIKPVEVSLEAVSDQMRAASNFADSVRDRYSERHREAAQNAAKVRDRETLLKRLLPLRAQYAEDERKLVFFSETQQLFDPMSVRVCPSCLEELNESPKIVDGRCTMCEQELEATADPIDVEAERAAIRARLSAIGAYIGEVENQLAQDRSDYARASSEESEAQAQMDSDLSEQLSPFVAQRDELVRRIAASKASLRDLERQLGWLDSIERRTAELAQIQGRIEELREEQRALEEHRPSRDTVITDLSARFEALLRAFGFPKLDDPERPYLDNDFVPHVRGTRYDKIGSRGGITLVALAWELAIFERAIEEGRPHPGFLMIDSPQSNLKPPDGSEDEFSTGEIGSKLWQHLAEWSSGPGLDAQLIVVDHSPPAIVGESVVITFSGNPNQPPYGLIANETA